MSDNPRSSAAYRTDNGDIQPCLILWNQRAYMQRVWNLLAYWRTHQPEPLEWHLHMTNTMVLPLLTWATVDLDHELSNTRPFAPEWLRAETIGLQAGNMPESLFEVYGRDNKIVTALPEDRRARLEWGMRMVHEIQRSGGKLDDLVTGYGYGRADVAVHQYWEDQPAAATGNDQVKWLLLAKPAEKSLLLVLASWSEKDELAHIAINPAALGFTPPDKPLVNAETGEAIAPAADHSYPVPLPGPYGVVVLKLE